MLRLDLTLRNIMANNANKYLAQYDKYHILAYDPKLEEKIKSGYEIVSAQVIALDDITGGNHSDV